ncbi:hypothetical protein LTR17_006914 [Elasticomyces elasticus]|nr:hypothetical protein LTR17_006914 [Elasticomyces elasticus]
MDDISAMRHTKCNTEQANNARAPLNNQNSNKKPVTLANDTPGLLRLPAELRNIIYELALPRDNFCVSVRTTKPLHALRCLAESATIPALLATCRLIRNDTLPIFYGTNIFGLRTGSKKDFRDTLAWLQSIGQRAVVGKMNLVVTGTIACEWHEYSHSFEMSLELLPESRRVAGGECYYGYGHISVHCLPADSRLRCGERIVREYAQRRAGAEPSSAERLKVELIAMVEEVHMRLQLPWWHHHRSQPSTTHTHTTKSGAMRQKKRNKKKGSGTRSRTKNRDSNSNKNTTNFPFLRLPPELRNMIYELALPRYQQYVPVSACTPEVRALLAMDFFHPAFVPALLAACHIIRTEALPMFYGNNTFILGLAEDRSKSDERQIRSLAWLEATDARGIASMTTLWVAGETNCVCKDHAHIFATQINLVQPEEFVGMEKTLVEGVSACPQAAARMRFATKLVREYALRAAAEGMSYEQAKVGLIAVMKRARRALHLPWWTCVVKLKLLWVLLVVAIAFGVLYFICRIVA